MFLKPSRSAKRPQLTCISLFAGCGGLDLGLEAAGFRIVVATDADSNCAESHRLNFPYSEFIQRRIGEVHPRELLDLAGLKRGAEVDLLAGGPPCPAFSKSRFYRKEKPRALDDPVAKETIGGYLRVLDLVRPRAFILENVKGLAYGVHKQALDTIIQKAEKYGYHTSWQVVNAADFGVPQIRERCIVMGGLDGPIPFPHVTHEKLPSPANLAPWVSAGVAIADLDTTKNARDEGHFAGGQYNDLLRQIPPGENYLYFTKERGHIRPKFVWRSRYWSFLLKLSPDMPSWTIQARRSNNMGPFHWRSRILRIAEVKRLQTFPDDFELVGTIEQQWRQIGNAVPPLLAERLGNSIMSFLKSHKPTKKVA